MAECLRIGQWANLPTSGNLQEMQCFRPHSGPSKSGSAFQEIPCICARYSPEAVGRPPKEHLISDQLSLGEEVILPKEIGVLLREGEKEWTLGEP